MRNGETRGEQVDEENRLCGIVVLAGIQLHRELGPGLFESVYEELLSDDLRRAGLDVQRQKKIDFVRNGVHFKNAFCVDLLLNDKVIIELKSVEQVAPVHTKQLLTYLRLMDLRVGLVMNFNQSTLREGLRRVINSHTPPRPAVHHSASARKNPL